MRLSGAEPVLFSSASGSTLRLEFSLEPVVSLRHEVVAAHRIARAVTSEDSGEALGAADVSRLPEVDVTRIDAETFAFARTALEEATAKVVITPASFHTLAA